MYYVKSGQYTDNALPENVVRVSQDGTTSETLAIGFRTPNGITISPDDRIFASDNQGNWVPANKISLIEAGKFYGYVPNVIEKGWSPDGIVRDTISAFPCYLGPEQMEIPQDFAQPIIWLPQEFDNSPGSGVWSDKGWGPYGGRFISSSFGTGWLYNVMLQEVDSVTQAAATAFPFQFNAGVQRVRVNPADKQLYLVGLTGWDDANASMYGTLDRIRYTGGQGHLLTDVKVQPGGMALSFNVPVDANIAAKPEQYEILQWNYRWEQTYC